MVRDIHWGWRCRGVSGGKSLWGGVERGMLGGRGCGRRFAGGWEKVLGFHGRGFRARGFRGAGKNKWLTYL